MYPFFTNINQPDYIILANYHYISINIPTIIIDYSTPINSPIFKLIINYHDSIWIDLYIYFLDTLNANNIIKPIITFNQFPYTYL